MPMDLSPWWMGLAFGLLGLIAGLILGWYWGRNRPAVTASPAPSGPSPETLRILALLQREGRLVDFLWEPIQAYPDAQIGAAVREIHRKCREALEKVLTLEKVVQNEEGEPITVEPGFDPAAIRLTGAVSGQPPIRGIVKHPGWRVRELRLPPMIQGQDPWILMPAEVEVA